MKKENSATNKSMDELYYKYGYVFPMAVAHLLDIGFRQALKITDKDIEGLEGNGIMTQEFVQDLVRASREIARRCDSPTSLICYCVGRGVFEGRTW